jgi:Sodium/hydrogen exchanger family
MAFVKRMPEGASSPSASSAQTQTTRYLVLANDPVSAIKVAIDSETLKSLAEVTLAPLLFSDAARINRRVMRHDAGVPRRLLVGGLPLTIALGTAFAVLLFPDLDPWAAAAIAPTDAALGAQVVDDQHVPGRIRRALNVESGLNDGIATPFVTFFIASAVANTVSNSSVSLGASLGGRDVADRGLCGPGPHRRAPGARGAGAHRLPVHPGDGRVHGLVRAAWPGLGRVRPDRVRLPGRLDGRGGTRGHHADGADERRRARPHGAALAENTPEPVPVPTLGGRPQTVQQGAPHGAASALVPELDE